MGFFQQCLQLILQTYFVTRPLIPCARECSPQTLFGIGHKAQGQLLRHKPLYQTFRIAKVFLAPAPTTIGQGLRQMQGSRHPTCTFSPLTRRFPVSFQRSPYRLPILRRGFHHHFLDLLLDQPLRKHLQLLRVASVPASLELVFLVDFHVSHNHRQLLLMDINSGCPIWHRSLLAGAESVPEITLSRLSGYRRSHGGKATHHLFALSRTLRIRQIHGLGFSTVSSISPRPARAGLSLSSERFSCGFAGRRPQMTDPLDIEGFPKNIRLRRSRLPCSLCSARVDQSLLSELDQFHS